MTSPPSRGHLTEATPPLEELTGVKATSDVLRLTGTEEKSQILLSPRLTICLIGFPLGSDGGREEGDGGQPVASSAR